MTIRIPPVIQALSWAVIIWAIAVFTPALTFTLPGRYALVFVFVGFGIVVELASVFGFIKARTTVDPINLSHSSELVTTGLYKVSRNPMYLGMLLLLIAWALFLTNLFCILSVIGFVIVMNEIQIKPEERALEEIFGDEFLSYKNRVRRWI